MNYSEILINQAQLMVALAGFSALLLALATYGEDKIHSDFNIRAMIVQAVFTTLVCLCALGILFTDFPLSEKWRLCSIVYIVASVPLTMLMMWDTSRVLGQLLASDNPTRLFSLLCWVMGVFGIALNGINTILEESTFAYFFCGLAGNTITGLLLFTRNIFLFTADPDQPQTNDQTQGNAHGPR